MVPPHNMRISSDELSGKSAGMIVPYVFYEDDPVYVSWLKPPFERDPGGNNEDSMKMAFERIYC
jgi:hypothetical protein